MRTSKSRPVTRLTASAKGFAINALQRWNRPAAGKSSAGLPLA
jgi:hypothetical protein